MSKITVTTIAGLTSGGDANTVKIESGDAFNVVSGATTLGGTVSITGETTLTGGARVNTLKHTGGTTGLTINSSGLVLPKMPILQVSATDTDQSMSAGTNTKVQWETVEIDTLSGWDSSNNRYTPTVAGYYLVGGVMRFNFPSDVEYVVTSVNKNTAVANTDSLRIQFNHGSDIVDNGSYPIATGLMQMNGSSDYMEVYVSSDEAATLHDSSVPKSFFFAKLVHAT